VYDGGPIEGKPPMFTGWRRFKLHEGVAEQKWSKKMKIISDRMKLSN
jgi:hypothetical protein